MTDDELDDCTEIVTKAILALALWMERIEGLLTDIRAAVARMNQKETRIMATLEETLAAVQKETTVEQSLIALTGSIKAELDQKLAGQLTPEQQAQVDQIFSGIEANAAAAAAAVTANTPAAAPPPAA